MWFVLRALLKLLLNNISDYGSSMTNEETLFGSFIRFKTVRLDGFLNFLLNINLTVGAT